MSLQRVDSPHSNTPSPSHNTNTTDYPISLSQLSRPPFDPPLIIAEAKESPPQDVEEARCFLALVHTECKVHRAEAQLADRLVTKDNALTEYSRLKAAKAWKRLGDAELMVGRAPSILSENRFSVSEITLATHRSEQTLIGNNKQMDVSVEHLWYLLHLWYLGNWGPVDPGVSVVLGVSWDSVAENGSLLMSRIAGISAKCLKIASTVIKGYYKTFDNYL
ncbi:hypothetical protein BDR07DRAFT_1377998 [Suillus spraguei]|nr:hypothetical protein BDR07DRAFT_1377998 [Suillus spraguei]